MSLKRLRMGEVESEGWDQDSGVEMGLKTEEEAEVEVEVGIGD